MTQKQSTVAISVGIATLIMVVVVIIVSTSNRTYMREYVKEQIQMYDSMSVTPKIRSLEEGIDSLDIKADTNTAISKQILKILQND